MGDSVKLAIYNLLERETGIRKEEDISHNTEAFANGLEATFKEAVKLIGIKSMQKLQKKSRDSPSI